MAKLPSTPRTPTVDAAPLFVDPGQAIVGAAVGYLSLWSVYWLFKLLTGKEGMGYGDFKLLAALGAWFGAGAILPIILMSSVVGAVVGGTIMAYLGGIHFWWPKITGRKYNDIMARVSAVIVFIGFNLTFLPQFVMGSRGMPRRYWDYDPEYWHYHQASTIGAFILGFSLFAVVCYLMWSFKNGKKATQNPWGGTTLEWDAPTPPTIFNFPEPPEIHELYNYDDLEELPEGGWVRKPSSGAKSSSGH